MNEIVITFTKAIVYNKRISVDPIALDQIKKWMKETENIEITEQMIINQAELMGNGSIDDSPVHHLLTIIEDMIYSPGENIFDADPGESFNIHINEEK